MAERSPATKRRPLRDESLPTTESPPEPMATEVPYTGLEKVAPEPAATVRPFVTVNPLAAVNRPEVVAVVAYTGPVKVAPATTIRPFWERITFAAVIFPPKEASPEVNTRPFNERSSEMENTLVVSVLMILLLVYSFTVILPNTTRSFPTVTLPFMELSRATKRRPLSEASLPTTENPALVVTKPVELNPGAYTVPVKVAPVSPAYAGKLIPITLAPAKVKVWPEGTVNPPLAVTRPLNEGDARVA